MSSTPRSWRRGTARPASPSPTAPSSAPYSTATACARDASGSPTTGSSCWPARPACSTSSRPRSSARAACSPAGSSSSTPRAGRIIEDDEIKAELAAEHPYGEWLHAGLIRFEELPRRELRANRSWARAGPHPRDARQAAADLRVHRRGAARSSCRRWPGTAPSRSARWAPTRRSAVLSDRPRQLFDYFKQLFAQVTNPPLDAIREELVTSLQSTLGPEGNLLAPGPHSCRRLVLPDADPRQRGDRQDHPHQRRGRPARLRAARRVRPVRRDRRGSGAVAAAGGDLRGGHGRDRGRRAHPRAVRPRRRAASWRRSRRCCSPAPSTTT